MLWSSDKSWKNINLFFKKKKRKYFMDTLSDSLSMLDLRTSFRVARQSSLVFLSGLVNASLI